MEKETITREVNFTPEQLGLSDLLKRLLSERRRVNLAYEYPAEYEIRDLRDNGTQYVAFSLDIGSYISMIDWCIAATFEDLAYMVTTDPKTLEKVKTVNNDGRELAYQVLEQQLSLNNDSNQEITEDFKAA